MKRAKVTTADLEKMELFRFVAPESTEGILDASHIIDLEQDEILLRPHQSNNKLYIILSGCLRIHLTDPGSPPVARLHEGETAGEMSVIDKQGSSAFVIADQPTQLLAIKEELIWSLVQVSHPAACNILRILTRRLRAANDIVSERMGLEQDLHCFGTTDALTGLRNRHWINTIMPRILERAERDGSSISVLMIDIDRFKQFNDQHGHLCGDRAIHLVAQALLDNLRPSATAGRYGGDEFIVILPDIGADKARIAANRLREKVAETDIAMADGTILPRLTISVGVAEANSGDTPEQLINAADKALYRAKEEGRDTVALSPPVVA